jgi:hypothetical protein
MTLDDFEFNSSAIIDKLNELSNKTAALASGILRLGVDRPSVSGLVNLAWEISYEIANLSRTLQPNEPPSADKSEVGP